MILGTLRAVLGAIYSRYRTTGSPTITDAYFTDADLEFAVPAQDREFVVQAQDREFVVLAVGREFTS